MHFLQAINSDLSVLIVCNKTGGTMKGDIKKSIEKKIIHVQSDTQTNMESYEMRDRLRQQVQPIHHSEIPI